MQGRFKKFFPFLKWAPLVTKRNLAKDLIAGLTGALVVLPQGVAFATIAGMPPEYGLYAGMIPAIIAALFGSSRHLVSGPTTAASMVLFSSLSALAEPGTLPYIQLALTLTFMVGLIELAMGFFKLGSLVNFISHSVVIGFTSGAGVLIAVSQIKNFFGLSIPREAAFHEIFLYLVQNAETIAWPIPLVGAATLLVGIGTYLKWPRAPYMIVAILAGSFTAFGLNQWGGYAVPTMGAIPSSLPPLSSPSFDPAVWKSLMTTAFAVTLFALTEALSISRAMAARSGQYINTNQEFIGQGLSNIGGAFFSGYVATGSFNRTAVNYEAGAKTPLAAIIAALLLMGIVLVVAPLAAYMPNAAMAGVLFIVGWRLIDVHHIAQIVRASKSETGVLAVTFFSTLFLDLEKAIFAGVILSLVAYLHKTSHPRIHVRVPNAQDSRRKLTEARDDLPECPQLRIIRVDGDMFFGAVSTFQETLNRFEKSSPDCKHLLIEMQGVNFIDVAGAEALARTAEKFRKRGGGLYLLRPKDRVVKFLERGGFMKDVGGENIFHSMSLALNQVYKTLDSGICATCSRRIFLECQKG